MTDMADGPHEWRVNARRRAIAAGYLSAVRRCIQCGVKWESRAMFPCVWRGGRKEEHEFEPITEQTKKEGAV